MKGLHNDIVHPGRERTTKLVRERFYWPGMNAEVDQWITRCERCLKRKSGVDKAPLNNVHTSYPLELVCFDFFTKFALANPTRNQTAKTTAEAFYNEFIVRYGVPTRLHSDEGENVEGRGFGSPLGASVIYLGSFDIPTPKQHVGSNLVMSFYLTDLRSYPENTNTNSFVYIHSLPVKIQ